MNTNKLKRAIGTFATRSNAETALRELRDVGFNMDKISVIARNLEPKENLSGAEVKPLANKPKVQLK